MNQDIIKEIISQDYSSITEKIENFIIGQIEKSNVNGVILGLSGGIDSAVLAYICKRRLKEKTMAIIMPDTSITPEAETQDALKMISLTGIEYKLIDIKPIVNEYAMYLEPNEFARGNLRARIRTNILYYYANSKKFLVLGSSDKSEYMIGYFTKFGDGASDITPIISLYKLQVREIAKYLGVPEKIISKKSSPHLWKEHEAEKELGVSYEEIDSILYCLFEKKLSIEETAEIIQIEKSIIEKIQKLNKDSEHKRDVSIKTIQRIVMKIQDTLSNSQQGLDISKKVKIYLCGVTVYDESHIGHARTIIVFDVLRRYLEEKGGTVEFIQNFTDVDDKIINRAKTENTTAEMISRKYIDNYFNDFDGLNVKHATKYPKATEHIDEIIQFIKKLVDNDIAYESKNGVYFSVSKFPEYGKLSKKKIEELQSGVRIEIDEAKSDPLDFALWKFSDTEPVWDSPWGKGRPGWHIECSAMSIKYLGETFDIHGGGRDLIFPHHENEIAQSESFTGVPFARIWMHVGMVTINGEKMSKSLGNIKSIKYVLENWGPNIIRLFCLSGHYSKPIDYSEELLKENLTKWRQAETCYYELIHANKDQGEELNIDIKKIRTDFDNALNEDFNTHLALSSFFHLVKETNRIAAEERLDKNNAQHIKKEFERMQEILGLRIQRITESEKIEINNLIASREKLRQEKNFTEADKIRDKLNELNVELIDHKERTIWMKKEKIKAEN